MPPTTLNSEEPDIQEFQGIISYVWVTNCRHRAPP